MSHVRIALVTVYALALAGSAAAASGEGSVNLQDETWTVKAALAYREGDDVRVSLSDRPFDIAKFTQDGKIDGFDFFDHDGPTITLRLEADGPAMCVDFSTGNGGGSSCNSDYPPTIKVTAKTADRVAGSMHWGEAGGKHIHVTFDVPITGGAP